MKKLLLSFFLSLAAIIGVQAQSTIDDELTLSSFGVSGTGYKDVTGVTATSNAEYSGNLAGGNSSIQLRSSNSNSGIVTTKSGGNVKKIVLEWNSNTASGRIVDVYGSNEAYSAASDLYNSATQGTKIGSIVYGTSTELEIADSYTYIGLRSNKNALYLAKITITWDNSVTVVETVATPEITPPSCTFEGSQEVAITCATEGASIYYTTNGTEPSESNGDLYEVPFTITETTTVKAIAVAEGMNDSKSVEATYEKLESTEGYYVKVTEEPADWSGKYIIVYEDGANAYVFNAVDAAYGYISATIEGGIIYAKSNIDNEVVTIETMEGGYAVKSSNGYIYGDTGGNKLLFNETTPQLNTIELAEDGSATITSGRVLRFNSANNQLRFRYYTAGTQKPVYLYKYSQTLPEFELNVSSAEWATLCLGYNAAIPADVKVYTATIDGTVATLNEVTGVLPANTGVIVNAAQGNYTFQATSDAASEVAENDLVGTLYNTTLTPGTNNYYILANDATDGIGLYLVDEDPDTEGYEAFTLGANKAYLSIAGEAASNGFSFRIEGTTAIDEVEAAEAGEQVIYDLTGRRVESINAPGIYIVNGKKVVIK